MGILSAGLAIGGSILGARAAQSANREAREAAFTQADLTYDTRMEEIRRMRLEQTYVESLTRARIAASGVEAGGTPALYENYLRSENVRQLDWARKSADQERKAIRQGAPGKGGANLQAASQLLQGVTSAIGLWNN